MQNNFSYMSWAREWDHHFDRGDINPCFLGLKTHHFLNYTFSLCSQNLGDTCSLLALKLLQL